MKKTAAVLLLVSLLATVLPFLPRIVSAEEVSVTDARALYLSGAYEGRAVIPALVKSADVAGIGRFLNEPSQQAPAVRIAVEDYWTQSPGTNVIEVDASRSRGAPDWEYPTNVPVVFFALRYGSLSNAWSDSGSMAYRYTNQAENAKLIFRDSPRAWFRVGRYNGLLHEFATNLWECTRTNPDEERHYEVLRDYAKLPIAASSRLAWDVGICFIQHLYGKPDGYLFAKMTNDPALGPKGSNVIYNTLLERRWTVTNGVWYAPQPLVPPADWTGPP